MHEQRDKKVRRLAAIITAALALALVALQPNVASERQDAYLERTAFCLNLLFTDPIAHAAQCGGAPNVGLESLVETGPDDPASPGPATTPPTTPCPKLTLGGNAGGAPCPSAGITGYLAPFIGGLFTQFAVHDAPVGISDTAVPEDVG